MMHSAHACSPPFFAWPFANYDEQNELMIMNKCFAIHIRELFDILLAGNENSEFILCGVLRGAD
jgi:hypothetical protein